MLIGLLVVIIVAFAVITWLIVANQMQRYAREQSDWAEHDTVRTMEHDIPVRLQRPEQPRDRLARRPVPAPKAEESTAWRDDFYWDD